jgi:hypothetical protein
MFIMENIQQNIGIEKPTYKRPVLKTILLTITSFILVSATTIATYKISLDIMFNIINILYPCEDFCFGNVFLVFYIIPIWVIVWTLVFLVIFLKIDRILWNRKNSI